MFRQGSESHFKVVLVSDRFAGRTLPEPPPFDLRRAKRRSWPASVHALALHTYTIKEWARAAGYGLRFSPLPGGGQHRLRKRMLGTEWLLLLLQYVAKALR
jgi:BolA protein